ncbi:hypothetical protein [Marinicella meishanensis]|uniref:hypothetical protein n=1 Tax=Marinicella meishanensis TaxID=2873263 RepID=UPI001CBD4B71|nr:hypothetical protein [Marinicella sp. NBU2979]
MQAQTYFYGAFLLQVVTISALIPWWVKSRLQAMMLAHPPADYPKLYPESPARMQTVLNRFMQFNSGILLVGLAMLAHVYWGLETELFGWDNQGGLTVYFLWQYLPFAYLGAQGVKHHQMMRLLNTKQQRSASLLPRRLRDHVTPLWQALIAATLLAYIGTVVYMAQNPFTGFAGYWNILFVLGLNAFFAVLLHFQIKGRKTDPHQSHHDRLQQQRLIGRLLVTGWVLANVFLNTNMWLAYWDMRDWNLVVQSGYFTLIALIMSQTNVHQPEDYSVYQ